MAAPIALLAAALVLRITDIFVFRLDERIGEIVLSKALGFTLVVAYVWWMGRTLEDIGLHRRRLVPAAMLGAGLTLVAFAVGGLVQQMALGPGERLAVGVVDPTTGTVGGAGLAVLLVTGNAINSFMEEGLFRGLMLTHFLRTMRLRRANLLQAMLFAGWHLVWPAKAYLTGQVTAAAALGEAAMLLAATLLIGLIYGYLTWRTDSLWPAWTAHFLNNTILNLVLVRTDADQIRSPVVVSAIALASLVVLLPAAAVIARRCGLGTLQPWKGPAGNDPEAPT